MTLLQLRFLWTFFVLVFVEDSKLKLWKVFPWCLNLRTRQSGLRKIIICINPGFTMFHIILILSSPPSLIFEHMGADGVMTNPYPFTFFHTSLVVHISWWKSKRGWWGHEELFYWRKISLDLYWFQCYTDELAMCDIDLYNTQFFNACESSTSLSIHSINSSLYIKLAGPDLFKFVMCTLVSMDCVVCTLMIVSKTSCVPLKPDYTWQT